MSNITFHMFCCSKSALWFFGISRKRTSMHHILHNDLHFSPHTCHANPAGTVILHVFRHTNLRFFTNFTLRTHLKRKYCVSLTFWVWNRSGIVGFNKKNAWFCSKIARFCKISVTESQIWCFTFLDVQTPKFTTMILQHPRHGSTVFD